MKGLSLALLLILGSFLTLPAHAWPEVDHMNMCGAPAKVVQAYGGAFRGWQAHDKYIANKNRTGYYYKTNCPQTVASVKAKPVKTKKVAKKAIKKRVIVKKRKSVRIAKSRKAKSFKRKVKYDLHADCVRVDRLNSYGASIKRK